MVKLLAFHLPQFHCIPENDEWWGKGFTEWTNVRRGKKLYMGHEQPKVPLDNNYYDLSNPDELLRQCELAKKYGIYGFCFYHYYMGHGKVLLDKPLQNMLKDERCDLPFCFAWANQSFERTWYRKDNSREMLLEQYYGDETEWKRHFEYLLPFFKDPRYIRIDNEPVFLIYMWNDIKMIRQMSRLWDELAKEHGMSGIYLVAMDAWQVVRKLKRPYKAIVEFEPIRVWGDLNILDLYRRVKRTRYAQNNEYSDNGLKNYYIANKIVSYSRANRYIENRKPIQGIKTFLGAFPGWDNTARKDESGAVFHGNTPHKFQKCLEEQIKRSNQMGSEFLFINAWNEWSEGAYLEPDEKHGYAYLEAVRKALNKTERE